MITLLKTERDNYIKETELANYNQNMMHINSFLENIYQSTENESAIFTKDILENKMSGVSSFYNFLSYYHYLMIIVKKIVMMIYLIIDLLKMVIGL